MRPFRCNLLFAIRHLLKNSGFTAVAVLTPSIDLEQLFMSYSNLFYSLTIQLRTSVQRPHGLKHSAACQG